MQQRACFSNRAGVGLLEVLIAVSILSTAILATFTLQINSLRGSQDALLKLRAMSLANYMAERIKANYPQQMEGSNARYITNPDGTYNANCATSWGVRTTTFITDEEGCPHTTAADNEIYNWKELCGRYAGFTCSVSYVGSHTQFFEFQVTVSYTTGHNTGSYSTNVYGSKWWT